MILISVDPGVAKDSAFAIFEDEKLVETFKSNDLFEINIKIGHKGYDYLVMEDQYLGLNTKTLKDLTRQSGRIMGIAELSSIETSTTLPIVWQSYFKIPRKPKGTSQYKWGKQHKLDIIAEAEKLTGWKFTGDDDTASAVLIGLNFIGVNNDL